MKYLIATFLTVAMVTCAASASAGTVIFESLPDESNFSARFGLTGAPIASDPVDGGAAFELSGDPIQPFSDALALPAVFPVPASALGQVYTVSFEVLLPTGSGIENVTGAVRFFGDADSSGGIDFGTGSEFSFRFENPNLAGGNFGIPAADRQADTGIVDAWQPVSFSGLIPTVDNNSVAIDLGQIFIGFAQTGELGGTDNDAVGNVSAFLRNVRLEAVPEPSSLALCGLAMLGLLGRRRS